METGTPGPISGTDPLFIPPNYVLSEASIVNDPGMHVNGGDVLSANVQGNALVSQGNALAIAAPGDPMDVHERGAGFGFKLEAGTVATQFGLLIVDQVNHDMKLQTWLGGVLQNELSFNHAGAFPNPERYWQDLGKFDEVRFLADQATGLQGGWGVDNLTIGNISSAECWLLGGFRKKNYRWGNDTLLVEPLLVIEMTLNNLPVINVPGNSALIGSSLYLQAFMYNPAVYPNDPVVLSQGLDYKIGVSTTSYGTGSGINMWPIGTILVFPGGKIEINFSLP